MHDGVKFIRIILVEFIKSSAPTVLFCAGIFLQTSSLFWINVQDVKLLKLHQMFFLN